MRKERLEPEQKVTRLAHLTNLLIKRHPLLTAGVIAFVLGLGCYIEDQIINKTNTISINNENPQLPNLQKDIAELRNLILGQNISDDQGLAPRQIKEIDPKSVLIDITHHFGGRVVAPGGLKARYYPDAEFGPEAPQEYWLRPGETLNWQYGVQIGEDYWVTRKVIFNKNGENEIWGWIFYAREVNRTTLIEIPPNVSP